MRMHNPAHPGRILRNYVGDRSVTEVAEHLGVTRVALSRVLNGKAGISAEMALRIGQLFNTEPQFWINLQSQRDLWEASLKRPRVIMFAVPSKAPRPRHATRTAAAVLKEG